MSGGEGLSSSTGDDTVPHRVGSKLSADDIKSITAEVAVVLQASSEPAKGMYGFHTDRIHVHLLHTVA